ncbi:MAG: DUF1761 domain-containing protein, partial [Sphingobacteriales bacterium]
MDMSLINWPAVIVAALSGFAIGGLWYNSAVFGKAWMADSNLTREETTKGNKGKIFGFTFVFSLLMSANLAAFLAEPSTDVTCWVLSAQQHAAPLQPAAGAG